MPSSLPALPRPKTHITTPRLTLTLLNLSNPTPAEKAYCLTILRHLHITTWPAFVAFCNQRGPKPWADSALLWLVRLRRVEGESHDGENLAQNTVGEEIIGHVTLAHSLLRYQPCLPSQSHSPMSMSSQSDSPISQTAGSGIRAMPTPDIGWGIVASHRRKGYAAEAAAGLLRYLMDHSEVEGGPRLSYVAVMTGRGNAASRGVAARVGFAEFVGERRMGGEYDEDEGKDKGEEEEVMDVGGERRELEGRGYLGEETWIGFVPEAPDGVVFGG